MDRFTDLSVCEIEPRDAVERSTVVGLLSTMLLRHVREDAESMGLDPIDLLAERLGVHPGALHLAAKQAGLVLPTQHLDAGDELLREAELNNKFFDEMDAALDEAEAGMTPKPSAEEELQTFSHIEWEALNRLHAMASESIPLVTKAEFQQGAGIDPQLSDRYLAWLTHLETAVTRKPIHPEDPEEMGFGEVPETQGGTSAEFGPKCVPSYDGWAGLDPADLGPNGEVPARTEWFWCSPASIVTWPEQREVATLETVQEAGADLTGLWGAVSQAMREQRVGDAKVVRRNRSKQIAKAETQIADLRALKAQDSVESRQSLRQICKSVLGKGFNWKLWDTVIDGVPHTLQPQSDGMQEPTPRPELGILARTACTLRREATRKAQQPIGIAWIPMDELPTEIAAEIAAHIGVKTWAVQVFFDVSECPWIQEFGSVG
jgi:hypothetical protein